MTAPDPERRLARLASPRAVALALVLLALWTGACRTSKAAPPTAVAPTASATAQSPSTTSGVVTPPLYAVSGGAGATLVLLGTIHVGPESGWSLSAATNSALDRADAAILELDPDEQSEAQTGDLLATLVVLPPSTLLTDVISPETAKLLDLHDARLTALGMPRNARIRLKPWYISAVLLELASRDGGYSMAAAVDHQVARRMSGRPTSGLETMEQQLRFFDDLSPVLQDAMLHDTLSRLDAGAEEVERLVAAWRVGDEAALAALAREGVEELPALADFYDLLLRDRNRRWITQLRDPLEDAALSGRTILVAVGALHMVGADGLPALLRAAGYRVEAVDQDRRRDGA